MLDKLASDAVSTATTVGDEEYALHPRHVPTIDLTRNLPGKLDGHGGIVAAMFRHSLDIKLASRQTVEKRMRMVAG